MKSWLFVGSATKTMVMARVKALSKPCKLYVRVAVVVSRMSGFDKALAVVNAFGKTVCCSAVLLPRCTKRPIVGLRD